MALQGANDYEKLKQLCLKTHKEQVIWFLNAFWEDGMEQEAEHMWTWVDKVKTFDLQKGAEGFELDELNAHRFLEHFKETMTVTEMRENLRSTGAITGIVRMVPITHILIFRFKKDWHKLVNAPQGDNKKEIEEAQRLLDEVSKALRAAEARAQEARARLKEAESAEAAAKQSEAAAKAREAEAKAAEADAKNREAAAKASEAEAKSKEAEAKAKAAESAAREAELRAAQNEVEAALAELKAQEDAFNNKTNELKSKSEDESLGQVTRNKAKAELAQHLGSDPLPLRRAKITQEAAVKKADKATQVAADARAAAEASAAQASKARAAAEADARQATQARTAAEEAARQASAARAAAEQARKAAEAARQQASDAKAAADAAAEECQARVEEAEAYLEEVKAKPGAAQGALWFMDRELHEARAYLPERKGGYRKNK